MHLWLKLDPAAGTEPVNIVLYDTSGKSAAFALADRPADNAWQELDLPLNEFTPQEGFDFNSVRSVQVEAALPKGARVWLDDVYFHQGESHLGVSDKTITQYMAEVAATQPRRAEHILRQGFAGSNNFGNPYWNGELAEANRLFHEGLTRLMDKESIKINSYNLHNPLYGMDLPAYYLAFSSKGRFKPGSLSPEGEQLLLEAMKLNDLLGNDIAIPRNSTWYITGSENHDYHKTKLLLYSQIFMHEPKFADMIYPNKGKSLGFQGQEDVFLHWVPAWAYAVEDDGNYSDGKDYKARDHYEAWVKYHKEYMAERARCGFFNEQGANGAYGMAAPQNFTMLHTWSEDEDLRRQARMFLDLLYANQLQDQMLLIQGGASSRGQPGRGGCLQGAVAYYMGHDARLGDVVFALSDYAWPRGIWELALDRKGRGEYAYLSRKPHEEPEFDAQPMGTHHVMHWRRDSRIARYSWVTPDYVMGMRMDHPHALYTMIAGSEPGITFPTSPQAAILLKPGFIYRAVQDRNVALMQQKRSVNIQLAHGFGWQDRFHAPVPAEVVFGKDVDHIEEQDGWVFIQEGDAFGAFRIVAPASQEPIGRDERRFALLAAATDTYTLEKDENGLTTLKAREPMMPMVVEMSRKARHATLEDFKKDILDNALILKSRSPMWGYQITYRGCGPDAKNLYMNQMNDEAPMIDGEYITYNPPAFESPWLKGAFDSGVVTLTGPVSGSETVLDFNERSPRKPNE